MKEINRKIIAFLKQRNDWTTSKDLSNEFQLSTRTIKNIYQKLMTKPII